MPQCRQPCSLLRLAQVGLEALVEVVCRYLEKEVGRYKSDACQQAVVRLRAHMASLLPCVLLERLLRESNRRSCDILTRGYDLRLAVSLYLHEGMKCLFVNHPDLDPTFWIRELPRLTLLERLHLESSCSDDMLEVVCSHCPGLQEISLDLYPGQDYLWCECLQDCKRHAVSDDGLRHVAKCSGLRVLEIYNWAPWQGPGKQERTFRVTVEGVRALVRSLPHLQYLSFAGMGSLLADGMDDMAPLPFTYYADNEPCIRNVQALARLCPRVRHMVLRFPSIRFDWEAFTEAFATAAATDRLGMTSLQLDGFPPVHVATVLETTGGLLTEFQLTTRCARYEDLLYAIGRHCPRLRRLTLKVHNRDLDAYRVTVPEGALHTKLFCALEYLNIYGDVWEPTTVLSMCLRHARGIVKIALQNMHRQVCDDVFNDLFVDNPFVQLRSVYLLEGIVLSSSLLARLVDDCPSLGYVCYIDWPAYVDPGEMAMLQARIRANNLNVVVTSSANNF